MRRLRVAENARHDIDAIFVHGVREYGLSNADAYVAGLQNAFAFVAEHPFAVRERVEVRPPVRLYRYRGHYVLYALRDEDIVILRVLHHTANWIDHL